MKTRKKRSYFVVIDLINHRNTHICASKAAIARVVGMHVHSIDPDTKDTYGTFLVISTDIE
jgi:hypothetical protein